MSKKFAAELQVLFLKGFAMSQFVFYSAISKMGQFSDDFCYFFCFCLFAVLLYRNSILIFPILFWIKKISHVF